MSTIKSPAHVNAAVSILLLTLTAAAPVSLAQTTSKPQLAGSLKNDPAREAEFMDWGLGMFVNDEAIHNVRPCVTAGNKNVYYTQSNDGKYVYAFLTQFTDDDPRGNTQWGRLARKEVLLKELKATPDTKITVLGHPRRCETFHGVIGHRHDRQIERAKIPCQIGPIRKRQRQHAVTSPVGWRYSVMGHGRVENPARFTRVGGHTAVHTVLVIGHRHQDSFSRGFSKTRHFFDVVHSKTNTDQRPE